MAAFKCKMCGGMIEFELGATIGVCDYCGTKQTLPRLDDDHNTNSAKINFIISSCVLIASR